MEPAISIKTKYSKRPDSLKLELLTIPEDPFSAVRESVSRDLHVGFSNLTYSVREGLLRKKQRCILKEVSGEFIAGDLTAIMGPSGCGKTTLMNFLAGFRNSDVKGILSVNGDRRDEENFRKQSCYIMQDDNLHPLLTVYESMTIAADLKLGSKICRTEKQTKVQEILEAIGLWVNRKTRTSCLSGGQRKRLAIALELLINPQVMFFDEPTSGLDSSSSKQCIALLKNLAKQGRTIICTIHQPSAMLFEMFDHLYAISEGKCIYQGSIKGLVPYLEEAGLQCPPYHNPADYLLEVAAGDYGQHYVDLLVDKSLNGKCPDWRKRQRNSLQLQSMDHIDEMMQSGLITPVRAPPLIKYDRSSIDYKARKAERKNAESQNHSSHIYSTSFFSQLYILLIRTIIILSRDVTLTITRIMTHVSIALIIGFLYFRIGEDAAHVMDNFNYLFFSMMFLMFTAFNSMTLTFPLQLPIIKREYFNQWYSLKSYYLAVTLADVPVQIFATVIYALLTFYMTSQPTELFRVAYFVIICVLISLVGQSFGMLVGTTLNMQNGVIFGPLCFLPFTIFSGFFVHLNDAHPYLRWLFHISFLKYGLEGAVLSVFGYNRGKLHCSEDYCHFVYPEKFIDQVDMENAVYEYAVAFLVGLFIAFRLLTFIALNVRVQQ